MPFKQEPFAYILAVTAVISSLVHCRVQNLPSSLHFSNSFMAATAVGSPEAYATEKENVLAKHVAFFDRNGDGIIHPSETYKGFRAIGCGIILSTASALFINLALSRKTLPPGKKLSLLFPIYISNISKCKHGSDSGVYDAEGRFVSEKFEEIFSKHAVAHRSTLTGKEMRTMLKANREDKDYGGWVGGLTEWEILYYLCKDKDGLIHKDTIRGVYDGSLFYQLEKKVAGHGRCSLEESECIQKP